MHTNPNKSWRQLAQGLIFLESRFLFPETERFVCSSVRARQQLQVTIGLWDVKDPTFSRQSAHRWRRGCQPYAPTALYSPETLFVCFWYSFLLEAERTAEPSAARGIIEKLKKLICFIGSRTRDLSACTIVPQPLRYRVLTYEFVARGKLILVSISAENVKQKSLRP
jgi:hypothetical protein